MKTWGGPVWMLLAVACTQPATGKNTAEVPDPPAPSETPPAPTSEPPATADAPPVAPKVTYPDAKPVLADLCGLAEQDGKVGCTCCPPFTDCPAVKGAPTPPGDVAYSPDVVLLGGFSAANQEEAVMGTHFSCEDNLSSYGHVAVARKVVGKWKLVDDFVDAMEFATTYELTGGRDLVIALTVVGKTPVYELSSWDFAKKEGERPFTRKALMGWTNDAHSGCTGVEPGTQVHDVRLLDLQQVDRDGDGKLDLAASLLTREGPPTPAYQAACQEMMDSEGAPTVDPAASLPEAKSERVFRFDGKSFAP